MGFLNLFIIHKEFNNFIKINSRFYKNNCGVYLLLIDDFIVIQGFIIELHRYVRFNIVNFISLILLFCVPIDM